MHNMITQLLLVSLCGWCVGKPLVSALVRRRDAAQAYASAFAREYEPYVFAAVPLHAPMPVLHVLSPAPLPAQPPSGKSARPYTSAVRHTPYTRPYEEPRPYSESSQFAESRPYVETRHYSEARPYAEFRPHAESQPYPELRHYAEPRPYSKVQQYVDSRRYPARPHASSVGYDEAGSEHGPAAPHRSPVRPPPTPGYAADYDSYAVVFPSSAPRVTFSKQPVSATSFESESQEAPAVLYARPSLAGGYTYRKVTGKTPPKKVSPSAPSKEQPVIVKIQKYKIIKS